jgi:hypothetical protein
MAETAKARPASLNALGEEWVNVDKDEGHEPEGMSTGDAVSLICQ